MKYIYSFLLLFPFAAFTQEEIRLPHPPGPENDETVLGIDSNNNNVRDDIEIYIRQNLNITDSELFQAYMNYAESSQKRLMYRDNREILLENDYIAHRDFHCVLRVDVGKRTQQKLNDLYKQIINTRARSKANAQMIKTLGNVKHRPVSAKEPIQSVCRK